MLEHRWEKPSKKACEHADESDVSSRRVSSLLPCSAQHSISLPAPSLQTALSCHTSLAHGESLAPASNAGSRLRRGLLLPVSHRSRLLFVHYWHLLGDVHQGAGYCEALGEPPEGKCVKEQLTFVCKNNLKVFLLTYIKQ